MGLWPVSRDAMPKQFLPLVGERSTYQQALACVSKSELFGPPIVMTANDFRFFARSQAEEIGIDATIVLEPVRRDSAAAVGAGAYFARKRGPDAIVLALAADHVILDDDLFADDAPLRGRRRRRDLSSPSASLLRRRRRVMVTFDAESRSRSTAAMP